jgi:hypothetical protein
LRFLCDFFPHEIRFQVTVPVEDIKDLQSWEIDEINDDAAAHTENGKLAKWLSWEEDAGYTSDGRVVSYASDKYDVLISRTSIHCPVLKPLV